MVERMSGIQIKGLKDGLLVTLGEGEWDALSAALMQNIANQAAFFQGARLTLDVGNHIVRAAELGALRDTLSERGVLLWAVIGSSSVTEATAQMLGLATRLSVPRPERSVKSLETQLEGEGAVMVHRTLRSGYKVESKGHVIVLGDVNPGAEIIAGGSVIVWGRLRGLVHAGALGDSAAVICALDLDPMQLRIAELAAVPPKRRGKVEPELARIVNHQVVAEPWRPNKGR